MKVVFVSSLLPSGHYSQYLTQGIHSSGRVRLVVYTDKAAENLNVMGCGLVKAVWSKSLRYISEILTELRKDQPDIVHLQHEINMFGGASTALVFPLLLWLIKLKKMRRVVTVHCAVPLRQIDEKFVAAFHKNSAVMKPGLIRFFFACLYRLIAAGSDVVIVHTNMTKDILRNDYHVPAAKIHVVPPSIPVRKISVMKKETYFLYFGYMVRRKGLPFVLDGFRKFLRRQEGIPWRLVLAGGVIPGQEQAVTEIKEHIDRDQILKGAVVVQGFVEESDLDALFGQAVAVVIPAEISMGASGPLYHAFSYGKVPLASKVGHLVEQIDHLQTGFLVDNRRWEDAFQFCVDHSDDLPRMEERIRSVALSRTPSVIAGEHADIYSRLPGMPGEGQG